MKQITILGSTGTIGVNTLDVIQRHSEKFQVFALTANRNVNDMLTQCVKFKPRFAVMRDHDAADKLRLVLQKHDSSIEVLSGITGLEQVSSHAEVDFVMAGIVGAAGLLPTLAAAKSGKRVMLANKEALVMSGQLFMDAIKENDAEFVYHLMLS